MSGLMLRTTIVVVILLATMAVAGYLAAHNMSTVYYLVPLTVMGCIGRTMLVTKVALRQPLPPLPSWDETKATMARPIPVAKHVFLKFAALFAFLPLIWLGQLFPVLSVTTSGVLAVAVVAGCTFEVRAQGRSSLPAKYIWMLTATSVLIAAALILMCGESIRSAIAPSHSGH